MVRTIDSCGMDAQARLARTHVCVVGAGSAGSIVLECLARAGFEQITVIDPDLVEVRNLDGGDHGRRNGVCVACRESLCNDAPKFPERTMAVAEKPEELRSDDAKAAQGRPARAGLSPAVERMFGALVNSSEEPGGSSASEPEATHAPRPGAA